MVTLHNIGNIAIISNTSCFVPSPTASSISSNAKPTNYAVAGSTSQKSGIVIPANFNRRLSISIDEATQKVVFTLIDSETGEIVRQIPPKEMLEFASKFDDITGRILADEA